MRRAPLVFAVLALALGLAAGLTRLPAESSIPPLLFLSLAGATLCWLLAARSPDTGHQLTLVLLAAAGVLLGGTARIEFQRSCLHWVPDDGEVAIVGRVVAGEGDRVRIRLIAVGHGDDGVPCTLELPARWRGGEAARSDPPAVEDSAAVPPGQDEPRQLLPLRPGILVEAEARWWRPPGAGSPPLRRPGALLLERVVRTVEEERPPPLLERMRGAARGRADLLFGSQSPLAASVLLANRDGLDPEVRDRFARAGLSHLLAISGLHVGLVCGILLLTGSLMRLSRRGAAILAAAGTVSYVVMLGAPHSALRAALQLVLLLAATMLQRPTRTEALVATAALLILVLEPAALLSPGFQLSFAGVVGLLVLRPPFLRLLQRGAGGGRLGRVHRWLADALATSIAATLSTAPIVAWHFGQVAPIGILANLLAIPLLSITLPALALALLVGGAWPAAGAFLAGPGALGLAALDRTAALAAALPGAGMAVHGTTALLLTAALAVGYFASGRLGRARPVIRALVWAGVACALLVAATIRPPSNTVEIHVIDVGQGDAIALRSPAGRWLLVDAGVAGLNYDAGERRVVPYLARRGVRRLEGLVLTHPHLDHIGGAGAVVRSLRPRWVGDPASPAASRPYLALLELALDGQTPWMGLRQGHSLVLDDVTVDFLHPQIIGAAEDDLNELSVVMKISYGEFTAVLTGDATARVESSLLRHHGGSLRASVLQLGHHGSSTSSSPEFLAATAPEIAFLSAGEGNRYGHPHASVIERVEAKQARVLRTDRHGSIILRADGRGSVEVRKERGAVQ